MGITVNAIRSIFVVIVLAVPFAGCGDASSIRESETPKPREPKTAGSRVRAAMVADGLANLDRVPSRGIRVGQRAAGCVVLNPAEVRDGIRRAIEQDDQEIDDLRLSDQDILAATCHGTSYVLATWSSNGHNVVGDYRRAKGASEWKQHVGSSRGPACGVPAALAQLWKIRTGQCM